MDEIKRILVAIAFSEHSKGIFNYASKLAKCAGAEIIVANVINSRDVAAVAKITSMGYEVDGDNYVKSIKADRFGVLDQMIKESSFPPEKVRAIFRVGNPTHELLKIVMEEGIDTVVMGVKVHTELEHFFVGSVAEKLFRRSPVTVISYRDQIHQKRLMKRIHPTLT